MDKEQKSILIVDDEYSIRKSFKLLLLSNGYRVFEAENSKEALQTTANEEIGVVLLDIKLGEEDGTKLIDKLLSINSNLKIIMLTSFPSYKTAVSSIKRGAYEYIAKSEESDKILSLIEKAFLSIEKPKKPLLKLSLYCHHSSVKKWLKEILEKTHEFSIIDTHRSVCEINKGIPFNNIDIVLLCHSCNFESLKEAKGKIVELKKEYSRAKFLVINDKFKDEEKVELLGVGIKGFLPVETEDETFIKAIEEISKGELWVSRKVLHLALEKQKLMQSNLKPSYNEKFGLTNREYEILKAIYEGLGNKEIARKFFISEKTVKTHISRILKKLSAKNRTEAIKIAIENKLL